MKFIKNVVCVFTILGVLAITGCKEKGPAEKAGESLDKAVEKTGDAAKDAGKAAKDAVNK